MATESAVHVPLKVRRVSMLLMVLIVALRVNQTFGVTESRTVCACPGDQLTFECASLGGAATIWHGSAFSNCVNREIILRHSRFYSQVDGRCGNNEQIIAQSVGVVNNTYFTSILNVTVSTDMNNRTIECDTDNVDGSRVSVYAATIMTAQDVAGFLSSLTDNIHLANISQGGVLTFMWSNTYNQFMCPTDYMIVSNCGTCPLFTTNTSAVCQTDLRGRVCMFSVLARACDRIYGNPRPQFVAVMLRVPDPPELHVELVDNFEVYTTFNMSQAYNISDGIDGSPISYTIIYYNSTSGASVCFSATIPSSSCEQGVCYHTLDTWMLSYYGCSGRGGVNVTLNVSVYATNILGDGPLSDPITVIIDTLEYIESGSEPFKTINIYLVVTVVISGIVLILCIAAAPLCIVIIIMVRRKKRVQRERNENTAATAEAVTYEEIGELQLSSRIDTSKNVAYCHVKELKSSK